MPDALQFLILALGVYRLCRLIGWDSFPPAAAAREWLTGYCTTEDGQSERTRPERPQWIDDLLTCPWCISWWVSLAAVVAFYLAPTETAWVMLPFALSAVVGLTARALDP